METTEEARPGQTWTIIGVADAARSYAWYRDLLGLPPTAPGMGTSVACSTTTAGLLCLHAWGAHEDEHPTLEDGAATPGNGLLLFFRVDDFDAAVERARGLVDALELEPQINASTQTQEVALRVPDRYYVMVSANGGNG